MVLVRHQRDHEVVLDLKFIDFGSCTSDIAQYGRFYTPQYRDPAFSLKKQQRLPVNLEDCVAAELYAVGRTVQRLQSQSLQEFCELPAEELADRCKSE